MELRHNPSEDFEVASFIYFYRLVCWIEGQEFHESISFMKLLTVGLSIKIEDSDITIEEFGCSIYPDNLAVHITWFHTVTVEPYAKACFLRNFASDNNHLMSFTI